MYIYKAPTDNTKPRQIIRKAPKASVCIRMHPICIHMHSYAFVCIPMHPYAIIRLIYASERRYSKHVFAEKVKTSTNR